MKASSLFFLLILLSFLPLSLSGRGLGDDSLPAAERGGMDLSSFPCSDEQKPVRLDGLWEFRWNELLEPGDSRWISQQDEAEYFPVPLFWTAYKDRNYNKAGQGTYRLTIITSGACRYYGISLPEIFSEYRFWVNGELVDERWGRDGENVLFLRPSTFVVYSGEESLEMILQVRNRSHSNAGIGQSILLGSEQSIRRRSLFSTSIDVILIAICLFAGMYHSIIFIFRREEKELLFFGLFCFVLALRTFTTGSTLMMQITPDLPFLTGSRIATAFIPLSVIFFQLFSHYFFRKYTPVKTNLILIAFQVVYIVMVLTTGSLFYSTVYSWYLLTIIASCLFIIGVNIYAITKKESYSLFFFSGFLILLAGIVNDMMHYLQFIITGYYLSAFFSGFILLESLILSIKFSREHRMVSELSERLENAVNTANLDHLTGIYNRRYLAVAGTREQEIAKRYGHPFSLVIMDIDHFKQINDNFGHEVGDIVIMKLASILSSHIRGTDVPARFGGDEFILLLPQTSCEEAVMVARKIRSIVEETNVFINDNENIKFTVSMGVACSGGMGDDYDEILRQADEMLYKSKEMGRNRVSCSNK